MSSRFWTCLIALTAAALLGASTLAVPPASGPGVDPPATNPPPPPPKAKPAPGPNPGRPTPPDRPDRPPDRPDTLGDHYVGVLVSAGAGKVSTTDTLGRDHVHILSATAQIICNGRKGTEADLRKGMTVEITTRPADPKIAVRVIARTTQGS